MSERSLRRTASARTSSSAHRSASRSASPASAARRVPRRPTPEEVGRAAGLKIRRDLARRAGYRSTEARSITYRGARYRESYRRAGIIRTAARAPLPTERRPPARFESDEETASAEPTADVPSERAETTPEQLPAESSPPAPDQPAAPSAASTVPANSSVAPGEEETTEDLAPDTAAHPDANSNPGPEEDSQEASLVIPHGAMPAPLRGSLESLERQNTKLDAEGLERIEDEGDLAARIADGLLVPVPLSSGLTVNANLPPNHRYCRPWTAHFLAELARAHQAAFHRPLEVSSAVRTVEYQQHLMRINGNAAPAEGDIVSPHLTGAAIDIAKEGLSREEIGWMRRRLLDLESEGKIDVEEEFRQACFHITVYKNYDPPRPAHRPSEAKEPQEAPAAVSDGSTPGL